MMKQKYLVLLSFTVHAASPGLLGGQPFPSSLTLSSCAGDLALGGVAAVTRRSWSLCLPDAERGLCWVLAPVAPKAQDETTGARCSPCQSRSRCGGWGGCWDQSPQILWPSGSAGAGAVGVGAAVPAEPPEPWQLVAHVCDRSARVRLLPHRGSRRAQDKPGRSHRWDLVTFAGAFENCCCSQRQPRCRAWRPHATLR